MEVHPIAASSVRQGVPREAMSDRTARLEALSRCGWRRIQDTARALLDASTEVRAKTLIADAYQALGEWYDNPLGGGYSSARLALEVGWSELAKWRAQKAAKSGWRNLRISNVFRTLKY